MDNEGASPIIDESGAFVENWTQSLPEEIRGGSYLEGVTGIQDLVGKLAESSKPRPFTMEDYRGMLPDDLRDSEDLKKFTDPAEIYKSFREVQKMASRKGDIPAPDSDPETIKAFYSKLGTPPDPTGYELKAPEGMELPDEFKSKVAELAHQHNIPKNMLEGFVTDYLSWEGELAAQKQQAEQEAESKALERLNSEWGDSANEMKVGIRQTASAFGATPEDMMKIENDPGLALLFGRIYGQLDERGMAGQVYAGTMAGIDTQVREIDSQIVEFYKANPRDKRINALQEKKAQLNARRGRYDKTPA